MPTDINDCVRREVLAQMARKGLSQQDLAAGMVMTQYQISRRLNGTVGWRVDELIRAARVLGVAPAQLVSVPAA